MGGVCSMVESAAIEFIWLCHDWLRSSSDASQQRCISPVAANDFPSKRRSVHITSIEDRNLKNGVFSFRSSTPITQTRRFPRRWCKSRRRIMLERDALDWEAANRSTRLIVESLDLYNPEATLLFRCTAARNGYLNLETSR